MKIIGFTDTGYIGQPVEKETEKEELLRLQNSDVLKNIPSGIPVGDLDKIQQRMWPDTSSPLINQRVWNTILETARLMLDRETAKAAVCGAPEGKADKSNKNEASQGREEKNLALESDGTTNAQRPSEGRNLAAADIPLTPDKVGLLAGHFTFEQWKEINAAIKEAVRLGYESRQKEIDDLKTEPEGDRVETHLNEAQPFHFESGWNNGKLAMESKPLTKEEEKLLANITETAFREMGERTRIASGDDQFYVDGLYEQLKKDKNSQILVKIVFLLCRQANPGSELIRSILARKDEQINKLIHEQLEWFNRGSIMGVENNMTWDETCGRKSHRSEKK